MKEFAIEMSISLNQVNITMVLRYAYIAELFAKNLPNKARSRLREAGETCPQKNLIVKVLRPQRAANASRWADSLRQER